MARYRAILEYDGTDLVGFQRQALGGRSAQGEVEAALGRIGWQGRSILGAGRTDRGVHATGQVVAFDLEWKHSPAALLRALNANLPADVAVRRLAECAPDFHPRYAALGRRYRYHLHNAPTRSPLQARYAWHVWPPALDLEGMQAAARLLMGKHDFATFGNDPDGGSNTVRTVSLASWSKEGDGLYFDIQAEAFLYRMVRSIVGTLQLVGAGVVTVAGFETLLQARDRAQCPALAPPQGLCLVEVIYSNEEVERE